jgi:hypothetical protein
MDAMLACLEHMGATNLKHIGLEDLQANNLEHMSLEQLLPIA